MSYYNVLFISENKLKENTAINENVDSSELRFAIQLAQNIYIQETCGTNLFQKLRIKNLLRNEQQAFECFHHCMHINFLFLRKIG